MDSDDDDGSSPPLQVHFYKLSRAHEVLTDEEHRRLYDESIGDGGEALARIRAKHGPSWGVGCQNAAYGCQGTNIVRGVEEPPTGGQLGTFGSAASCLEACEAHPDCHAYAHYTIGFQAQGSDASTRPKAGKCYMRSWVREEILWQPAHEPHVTSGFCPGAARKHAAEKYGQTSLLRLLLKLWFWASSLPSRLRHSVQDSPQAWGTLVTLVATCVLVLHVRERRRAALEEQVRKEREAYRGAELARMKEEIEHRSVCECGWVGVGVGVSKERLSTGGER